MLLLGDQLIRDAGIAVFELVKNAYDADATTCKVTLKEIDKDDETAQVIVQDNGCGMDLPTVTGIWLEPGTENRKKQKEAGQRTPKFKRLPLGEKGVGRFAVHKLGRKVRLVTRAKDEQEVVVTIDWSAFDKDKYLSQVPVKIVERDPLVFKGRKTGTRITIDALHERPWTRARVRSLYRAINSICSPVSAPESFRAELIIEPESDWLEGLLASQDVLEQAIFKFEGRLVGSQLEYDYVFQPGAKLKKKAATRRSSEKMTITAEDGGEASRRKASRVVDLERHSVGPVEFAFYIFDREPRVLQLTSTDVAGLKSYLDNNGGIFVYRDGVRVYDYGEPGNDWLDLGGRRINVPTKRIGNNQVLGSVQLTLGQSNGLIEKTNREGFVENDAYHDFRDAVRFAIKQAEHERNQDKDRIRKAYSEDSKPEPVLDDIAQIREEVKGNELEKGVGKYLDRIEVQYREVLNRLLVAAGAGLSLSVVLHEVEKRITDLRKSVERGDKQSEVIDKVKTLSDMIDGITWLTRSSGTTLVKASALIAQAELNWKFRFQHHEIKVVNGFKLDDPDPDFSVKCNRRMVMSALMNLIDNAIYWLGNRPTGRKLYLGTSYELNDKAGIVIADNGPGFIDPPEYLVDPFVTRKPDGMGLGLHIAYEVMKQQGGQLAFPSKGDVTLPKEFTGAVLLLEFEKEAS
jgi:signal transduction histidine kinase